MTLEQALGGEELRLASGRAFFRRSQRLASHLSHGPFPLARAQESGPHWLYLDTETTGLAGGSGTYAFLVGLAYFRQDHLHIEQLIMRDHSEEPALLEYLASLLPDFEGLVTFNGKSFDVPLLQTRLVMNRRREDLEDMEHWDLLPLARQLWSLALDNCKLATLEERILGLSRQGDIPGWMVPQIFFNYLQNGDARGLAQVAEHNRRDLLAMVGLVAGLGGYQQHPQDWNYRFRQDQRLLHLEDLALGQQLFRRRDNPLAQVLLTRAWDYCQKQPPDVGMKRCGSLLARLYRRQGLLEPAREIWLALGQHFPRDAELLEQVAKQHEHHSRDWATALEWVERALALARLPRGRRQRLLHRRQRLQQRLSQGAC